MQDFCNRGYDCYNRRETFFPSLNTSSEDLSAEKANGHSERASSKEPGYRFVTERAFVIIHSHNKGHLHCFYFLAITNKAVTQIHVQVAVSSLWSLRQKMGSIIRLRGSF